MKKILQIRFALFAVLAAVVGVVSVLPVTGRALAAFTQTSADAVISATNVTSQILATGGACPVVSVSEMPLSSRGTKTVRVTADCTITAQLRNALAEWGARIIAPVGPRTVLIEATPAAAQRILSDGRFTAEDVLPAAKIQKELARKCAESPKDNVKVSVLGLSAADRESLVAYVVAQGGKILHSPLGPEALAADIPSSLVASLAARGDVRWIEPAPEHCLLNDMTVVEAGANVDRLRTKHKLRGRGQRVTVCDTGLDKGLLNDVHLDFSGRVKQIVHIGQTSARQRGYTPSLADYHGHGTHVAGTVLGDGTRSDGRYKGAAPAAELYFEASSDTRGEGVWIDSYTALLSRSVENGAYIHSDSWGSAYARSSYDAGDADFDTYIWNNPELLVVVAAGNAGDEKTGDYTISSSPACAKNVLTVGNTMSSRPTSSWLLPGNPANLNPTSSRGPTADGRIKPEVAAPGTAVYSTLSSKCGRSSISGNKYYTEMTGTSMATPLVSGTAALVREWLADRRGMAERPTAALMKAILAGGGVSMTGVGAHLVGGSWTEFNLPQELPNTDYGWGRVNLEETLYPTNGRAIKFADRIPFADQQEWTFDVMTTNAAPLDVQLCWIDYPADASTDDRKTLINDLDLIVSNKTTGAVWRGNGIAGGDHVNTMESVRIPAVDAPAGEYAVIVRGFAVSYDSTQGGAAAVYVRGAFEDETAPDPINIRNVRTKAIYEFLDEALDEVQSGDTLEILRPADFAKSVTLSASCTIVATNPVAKASLVTRINDAALTVENGATLTLSNIVFSASEKTLVTVAEGGNVTLKEGVVLGVSQAAVAISTADAGGFTLAGSLSETILFHCEAAKAVPSPFGKWTCDYPTAQESAAKVVCFDDVNRETRGSARSADGALVWKATSVPVEDSAGYFVDETGATNAYARIDRVFELYAGRLAQGETIPEIVIRETADSNARFLSQALVITNALTIHGETADATIVPTNAASFTVVEGGSLVLTNVVFRDYRGPRLFSVIGGEMTLASGATLKNLTTELTTSTDSAGVTYLEAGILTMMPGAAITGCSAQGDGWEFGIYGGGICAFGGTLRLLGGTISGCSAVSGGGVFVWNNDQTAVELAGSFICKDNAAGSDRPDNLCLGYGTFGSLPQITAALDPKARIGLSGFKPEDEGLAFASVTGALTEEKLSGVAGVFSCDNNGDESFLDETVFYSSCEIDGGETNLVWKVRDPETGECDPADAWDLVIYNDGTPEVVTNYYDSIEAAFDHLKGDCTIVMVSEFGTETFGKDLVVSNAVRMVSDCVFDDIWLSRVDECSVRVKAGASLVLSNVVVYGTLEFSPEEIYGGRGTVFDVQGGALTFESGSGVGDAQYGNGSWAAAGVCVSQGGTFTMRSGSFIECCTNNWYGAEEDGAPDKEAEWGRGGGLLVFSGTAYLEGGSIRSCHAAKGGGVYIANEGTAYVSGDFTVEGNTGLRSVESNFEFDGSGRIVLVGKLTGDIGVTRGTGVTGLGTNEFGVIEYAGDLGDLVESAARFRRDGSSVSGVIVTNATTSLLVWSNAVAWAEAGTGCYVDDDGCRYGVVTSSGGASALPELPAKAEVKPIVIRSVSRNSETEWTLVLGNCVPGCRYRLLSTDSLAKGFTVTGEWVTAGFDVSDEWVMAVTMPGSAMFWKIEGCDGGKPAGE